MTVHVAFLRGINVGGHTVRNERLSALCTQLGLAEVQPFLSTGNVIFRADDVDPGALETKIGAALEDGLGYQVLTFVRTGDEVAEIAAHDPFPDLPAGGKLHVGFLRNGPDRATREQVASCAGETDRVAFHDRELYWHVAGRFKDSALSGQAVADVFGDGWTLRTANTVRRIAAKLVD